MATCFISQPGLQEFGKLLSVDCNIFTIHNCSQIQYLCRRFLCVRLFQQNTQLQSNENVLSALHSSYTIEVFLKKGERVIDIRVTYFAEEGVFF